MASDTSHLGELVNDLHPVPFEKGDSVEALLAVSGLLCDLTLELDCFYNVRHARGHVDAFFESEVEGRSVLELVTEVDREQVGAALQCISIAPAYLQPAVLLCDHGIGTMETTLLILGVPRSHDDLAFIIGVRTQNLQGLTLPSMNSTWCSEATNNTFCGPSASLVLPYRSDYRSDRSDRAPTKPKKRISVESFSSTQTPYSEISFQFSQASVPRSCRSSSHSLAYSASTISSRLPKPTTSISGFSLSSALSRVSASRGKRKSNSLQDSQTQTLNVEVKDQEMQTESTHIPSAVTARRPPPNPSVRPRKFGSHRSNSSTDQGARSNSSSKENSKEPCESRRSSRSNSDGKTRRQSIWSSGSSELVLRHFTETPSNTICYHLDALAERINARVGDLSCCYWHATIRTITLAIDGLADVPCKGNTWLPSSGWQCPDCFALNEVYDDECQICFADRTQQVEQYASSASNVSTIEDSN